MTLAAPHAPAAIALFKRHHMKTAKLVDVVATLSSFDQELTIYAKEPWTCDSDAIVAREPDGGGIPREARALGAVYFLEVFDATDIVADFIAMTQRATTNVEQCERVIRYAIDDA